jgi:hypothetical protein
VSAARAELAAALERVNALYLACPEPRPVVAGGRWDELEERMELAIEGEDETRALDAIAEWERFATNKLRAARRAAA